MQSARLAVPREGSTGRRPPGHFDQPEQFGCTPPIPGAPGGGRASLPRGSREEPGSPASKISKELWAVDLEPHLVGLVVNLFMRCVMTGTGAAILAATAPYRKKLCQGVP